MTDIFRILETLYILWIIVALIIMVFAIRLRIKIESLEDKNESDTDILEVMLLNKKEDSLKIPSVEMPSMKNIEINYGYMPFIENIVKYHENDLLIKQYYDFVVNVDSEFPKLDIRTRSRASRNVYRYRPDAKIVDFSRLKVPYDRENNQNPAQRHMDKIWTVTITGG